MTLVVNQLQAAVNLGFNISKKEMIEKSGVRRNVNLDPKPGQRYKLYIINVDFVKLVISYIYASAIEKSI